ncbi:MAG: DUF3078 domain-containing protein, partial [Flavobacteriaceae bacterium]|nr:DUF3078 domain-containing protein [Flavobacteriaceae bacterium]
MSKNQISLILLFFVGFSVLQSQEEITTDSIKPVDSLKTNWKNFNKASLDISEVAFVNWNAGGSNSISGLLGLEFQRNFNRDHMIWENNARIRYGVNKQQDQDIRKTDDLVEINSTFGFRKDTISNWYYSANFNFKTQFTNGYNYANSDTEPISRFMAPAYMFLGVGTVYGEQIESFSAYLSPLTVKSTFVLDQALADAGAFGVKRAQFDDQGNKRSDGKNIRKELGILLTGSYKTALMENITVNSFLSLYTDYINDFGNIDIDWRINFDFTVNSFVRATLGSHLIYDNDIKVLNDDSESEENELLGAKVQWKQLLGI